MTTSQFTHPLGETTHDNPLLQDPSARSVTVLDAHETRGLLKKLGEFILNFLDRYVELVGPDTANPPAPMMSWTPYSGQYMEAMRWRSNRYGWGGN
jgi:hypothetical protein